MRLQGKNGRDQAEREKGKERKVTMAAVKGVKQSNCAKAEATGKKPH